MNASASPTSCTLLAALSPLGSFAAHTPPLSSSSRIAHPTTEVNSSDRSDDRDELDQPHQRPRWTRPTSPPLFKGFIRGLCASIALLVAAPLSHSRGGARSGQPDLSKVLCLSKASHASGLLLPPSAPSDGPFFGHPHTLPAVFWRLTLLLPFFFSHCLCSAG